MGQRWYSDAKDTDGKEGEKKAGDSQEATEPSEVDKLKVDLDAKNKEVIDLKVRLPCCFLSQAFTARQISPLVDVNMANYI